jgi:hypothetical protein
LFLDFFYTFAKMHLLSTPTPLMNGKSNYSKRPGAGSNSGSSAKGALLLGILGVGALVVALAIFNSGPGAKTGDAVPQNKTGAHAGDSGSASGDSSSKPVFGDIHRTDSGAKSATPKQAVTDVVSVANMTNEISAEDAKKFHDGLTELVRQGAASVPAIQDYLDKNLDSNYSAVKGAEELGYSSVRHALLDTLKQIGGAEAEGAMTHVLQTTAEPNEVAELAKDLEQIAPGQHRDEALQAAKEALDMAYNGQLGSNIERGPLFRVFQIYGASYAPPNASATTTQ